MKKTIILILLIVMFLFIYFLQSNFFIWFNISGVMPNLLIILILFIGLFMGRRYGLIYGILYGFLLDSFIGRNVGISSIMFSIIGIIGGYIDKNFSKDSRFMIMTMVAGTTIIFELGTIFLQSFILKYEIANITALIKMLSIEIFFNIIITIIIYPIFKSVGYYIEGAFKENNILTRYF